MYKTEAIKSFKGTSPGEIAYLGPYFGTRLGWEYVVFLRKVTKTITHKAASSAGYGTIDYSEIFDEGYTSMVTSYECIFDGEDIAQRCDYGVKVCTDYIRLPKSMPTFPPKIKDLPFGCRWVRKAAFVSFLDALSNRRK